MYGSGGSWCPCSLVGVAALSNYLAEQLRKITVRPSDVERHVRRVERYKPMLGTVPIAGITGPNGSGKTLVMVAEALADMRAGRPVYSTVPIEVGPYRSHPIVSMTQLTALRDATVCLDEVVSIFPSSANTATLPAEIQIFLNTARHRGVTVRWSAPTWMRAQVLLRGVTQAAVSVNPIGKRTRDLWPEPWWSAVTIWDARTGKVDSAPERVLKRRPLLLRRSPGWGAYDTRADTPQIGFPETGGICIDCGGTRQRPKCSPDRHIELGIVPDEPHDHVWPDPAPDLDAPEPTFAEVVGSG